MKKCQNCGLENADEMNFCLQCGATLANAPLVINTQNTNPPSRSNANTEAFGKSMETVAGGQSFQPNFQPNFQTAATPPRKSSKLGLIIGGILGLLLLVGGAGAAIVYFNWKSDKREVYSPSPSPTTSPRRIADGDDSPSPTPSPTGSKTPSQTPSPKPLSDDEDSSPDSDTETNAKFDKIWIDYDVTENGKYGMRVHTKFTLKNMKGKTAYLAVFVQKKDGDRLKTKNPPFRSKSGDFTVYALLEPPYDSSDYNDVKIFLPYNEFNLKRGKYALSLDVDLIDKGENFLQHLAFEDFDYTKQ